MKYKSSAGIFKLIQNAQTILLVTHYNPDADAFGSTLGLGLYLEMIGKKVFYYNRDDIPYNVRFLPSNKFSKALPPKADLCLMLDAGQKARIGSDFEKYSGFTKFGVIDHHEEYQGIGDESYVDPSMSSTSEMIYDLLVEWNAQITRDIGECLYSGLVYDTGNFRHPNTTVSVFTMAAHLKEIGVNTTHVSYKIFGEYPFTRLKLFEHFLQRVEIKGKWIFGFLTLDMIKQTNTKYDQADGFINQLLNVEGVQCATIFREDAPGKTKFSLRSLEKPVIKVAQVFGGGGHNLACGGTIQKAPEQAQIDIESALFQHFPEWKN